MPAPDIEAGLVAWLDQQYPDARVCTELPAGLAAVLPVIQVGRIGGQNLQIAVDRPTVDIDCYGENRIVAREFAYDVWNTLRFVLPGQVAGDAYISKVQTINAPNWTPYDNTDLRRFTSTVQLFSRAA